MRWLVLIAAGVALAGTPAAARDCTEQATVIEQIDCTTDALAKADADLNAVWRRVMAEHPSGGARDAHQEDIRAAQRAWIAFRDADCEAASQIGIPKYWEANRLGCLLQHTESRTQALRETYLY